MEFLPILDIFHRLWDTVARTLKVAIRDENCRIRDENCRFLCSNSVILVYTLFTILKSRRELHISWLKKPLKSCNSRRPHFSSTRELLFSWQDRYTNLGKPVILVVSNSRQHENYFSLGNRETANLGVTRITFLYERKSQLFIVFHPLRHPSLAHHLLFSTGNYSILYTTQRSIQCLLISSTCSPMVLH